MEPATKFRHAAFNTFPHLLSDHQFSLLFLLLLLLSDIINRTETAQPAPLTPASAHVSVTATTASPFLVGGSSTSSEQQQQPQQQQQLLTSLGVPRGLLWSESLLRSRRYQDYSVVTRLGTRTVQAMYKGEPFVVKSFMLATESAQFVNAIW